MKLKLNALVAAVAVLAAGAAQAQLSSPGTGTTAANSANGSLTFVFVDSVGSPVSFEANLRYNLLDFLPSISLTKAPGTIVWDFKNNTLTAGGTAVAGTYNWGSVFNAIGTAAQAGDLQWGVYAADNNGNATAGATNLARRNLAVTLAAGADTSGTTTAKLGQATGVINTYTINLNAELAPNTIGTLGGAGGIGAASATSGNAYLLTPAAAPGTTMNGGLTFNYLFSNNTSANFALLTSTATSTEAALNAAYDGTFNFDYAAGTLTYTVAAIPEPDTYAMMLGGLAAAGFLIRRRRAA
jgi:hypothetical protein